MADRLAGGSGARSKGVPVQGAVDIALGVNPGGRADVLAGVPEVVSIQLGVNTVALLVAELALKKVNELKPGISE